MDACIASVVVVVVVVVLVAVAATAASDANKGSFYDGGDAAVATSVAVP